MSWMTWSLVTCDSFPHCPCVAFLACSVGLWRHCARKRSCNNLQEPNGLFRIAVYKVHMYTSQKTHRKYTSQKTHQILQLTENNRKGNNPHSRLLCMDNAVSYITSTCRGETDSLPCITSNEHWLRSSISKLGQNSSCL